MNSLRCQPVAQPCLGEGSEVACPHQMHTSMEISLLDACQHSLKAAAYGCQQAVGPTAALESAACMQACISP